MQNKVKVFNSIIKNSLSQFALSFCLLFSNFAFSADLVDQLISKKELINAEALISANEDKAIEMSKKLIKRYIGTSKEAPLRHKLAELYLRKVKSENFFEQLFKKGIQIEKKVRRAA